MTFSTMFCWDVRSDEFQAVRLLILQYIPLTCSEFGVTQSSSSSHRQDKSCSRHDITMEFNISASVSGQFSVSLEVLTSVFNLAPLNVL